MSAKPTFALPLLNVRYGSEADIRPGRPSGSSWPFADCLLTPEIEPRRTLSSARRCRVVLKPIYLVLGLLSLAFGTLGLFLPLLPTVPFILLAAFFFSKGSQRLEAWLLSHKLFGSSIRAWRQNGSISANAKRSAYAAFVFSALVGLISLQMPWTLLLLAVAGSGSVWIYTRPEH